MNRNALQIINAFAKTSIQKFLRQWTTREQAFQLEIDWAQISIDKPKTGSRQQRSRTDMHCSISEENNTDKPTQVVTAWEAGQRTVFRRNGHLRACLPSWQLDGLVTSLAVRRTWCASFQVKIRGQLQVYIGNITAHKNTHIYRGWKRKLWTSKMKLCVGLVEKKQVAIHSPWLRPIFIVILPYILLARVSSPGLNPNP
jgi:hypothetical protein